MCTNSKSDYLRKLWNGIDPPNSIFFFGLQNPIDIDGGSLRKSLVPTTAPLLSDYHMIFSTLRGYPSYRHKTEGTEFIRSMCANLDR